MSRRHAILTALAAIHLVIVGLSSAGWIPEGTSAPEKAYQWYGSMSGATNRYGFFKQVGTSCRVVFTMTDRDGKTWQDQLSAAGNREADLRMVGSVYMILDFDALIAQSWAATMFGRHPEAVEVSAEFQQYSPPSMDEWRRGERPEWETTSAFGPFYRTRDVQPK